MRAPDYDQAQPLIQHLIELRTRFIRILLVFFCLSALSYCGSNYIFQFLLNPLQQIFSQLGLERKLIYTGLTEAFLTYLKVSMFSGFFLTFPYFASQIWLFISPGLFKHEQKLLRLILLATPVFFLLGAAFAYGFIFPNAYKFFLSFESLGGQGDIPIQLEPRVSEYLSFVMRLIIAFGVSFQLPILLTVLASMGLVTKKALIEKWRISVVSIFAVAAVITPPDILSMVGLAAPLVLLYGLSIIAVARVERAREKKEIQSCSTLN
ncbi:MAG: twin-arginine translocase subunit TatC [Candidatus Paracaedibacteraceae bacterium]|nr:twin-arginine translocase subunit TatC [Candidatus Paracaedibacteraceae bacterium]